MTGRTVQWAVGFLAGFMGMMVWAGQPVATISFPPDSSLCRATVPIFGSAMVANGKDSDFKEWRLEYGEGRNPVKWTRIAGDTHPVKSDPWAKGTVVWNPNNGAPGNLASWNTGLAGYAYGEWRTNFNGIYTLRLTTELQDGRTAEKRVTLMIGEAIVLLNGGTAVSVDGQCRFSVPPFSQERDNGLVVVILRCEPPQTAVLPSFPTAEMGEQSRQIYQTVPSNFTLLTPIYRVFPVGLQTDPPCQLEMDLPSNAGSPPNDARIFFYNASQKKWMPVKTGWAGKTAVAKVSRLFPPEIYFAVMRSSSPPAPPEVTWQAESVLQGRWTGSAESGASLRMTTAGISHDYPVGDDGSFDVPFVLSPRSSTYEFTVIRSNGETSKTIPISQSPPIITPSQAAQLRVLGKAELTDGDSVYLECEDPSALNGKQTKPCHGVIVQRQDLQYLTAIELKQLSQGSSHFTGTLRIGSGRGEIPPNLLKDKETLTANLSNGTSIPILYRDKSPPLISQLSSPTHPAALWSNPADPNSPQMRPLNVLSGAEIAHLDGAIKITGTRNNATRLVRWPTDGFSLAASPIISFDYRCSDIGPWQMLLRYKNQTYAIPLGAVKPYFPVLMPTTPLVCDSKWHSFEVNLQQGVGKTLDRVDEVLLGSWLTSSIFLTVEPGFKSASGNALQIKNCWIGKPSTELSALLQWTAEDPSGVRRSEWWVDEKSDSMAPGETVLKGTLDNFSVGPVQKGEAKITLPNPGRWYFHVRAEDTAGNVSNPVVYALHVIPSGSERKNILTTAVLNSDDALSWMQPEGKLSFKLPGLGTLFDPSKTEIQVEDAIYPISKCVWEPVAETLVVDQATFCQEMPLGFDGETMRLALNLFDINGLKLEYRPQFKVKIQSPFTWRSEGSQAHLDLKSPKDEGKWYAHWANPSPPWAGLFPGVVNNTLILSQRIPFERVALVMVGKVEKPTSFARPIRVKPPDAPTVVWKETWQSPEAVLLDPKEAMVLQDTTKPGYKAVYWTWKQDGSESFNPNRVRIVGLAQDGQFGIQTVPISQLADILNRQKPGSRLRMDGWLHPIHARSLHIKVSGKRRVSYAQGESSRWLAARDGDLRFEAKEDWTRFSILIEASSRYIEQGGSLVQGESYW